MRKLVKAAAALTAGCMLLSTSAFAMSSNLLLEGENTLTNGAIDVNIEGLKGGQSTIIVLKGTTALADASEENILYINQTGISETGTASYNVNLGAAFEGTATVYAGGTNETATTLGVLKGITPVNGLTLAVDKSIIAVDETAIITPTFDPTDATDKTLTWASSNDEIATVADGVVTAKAVGKVTITATTANKKSATIDVTVASLALDKNVAEVVIGESVAITATVAPADTAIVWSENVTVEGNVATFTVPETATAGDTFEVTATVGTITKKVTITAKAAEQETGRVFIPSTGADGVATVTTKNITNANKKWYTPADVFANGSKKVKIALAELAADDAVGTNYMINVVNGTGEIISNAEVYYSSEGKFFIALVPAANNADYKFELIKGDSVNTATVIKTFGNLTNPARVNLLDANVILAATRAFDDSTKNKINSNLLAITADLTNDGNVNLLDYNAIVGYTRNSTGYQFNIMK